MRELLLDDVRLASLIATLAYSRQPQQAEDALLLQAIIAVANAASKTRAAHIEPQPAWLAEVNDRAKEQSLEGRPDAVRTLILEILTRDYPGAVGAVKLWQDMSSSNPFSIFDRFLQHKIDTDDPYVQSLWEAIGKADLRSRYGDLANVERRALGDLVWDVYQGNDVQTSPIHDIPQVKQSLWAYGHLSKQPSKQPRELLLIRRRYSDLGILLTLRWISLGFRRVPRASCKERRKLARPWSSWKCTGRMARNTSRELWDRSSCMCENKRWSMHRSIAFGLSRTSTIAIAFVRFRSGVSWRFGPGGRSLLPLLIRILETTKLIGRVISTP